MTDAVPLILAFEENASVQKVLVRALAGSGFEVAFAESDSVPNSALATDSVAAIMVNDEVLEQESAESFLLALRTLFYAPIIWASTLPPDIANNIGIRLGIAVTITKPYGLSDLRKALAMALNNDRFRQLSSAGADAVTAAVEDRSVTPRVSVSLGGRVAPDEAFDKVFDELQRRQPLEEGLDAFDVIERHLIRRALSAFKGNQSQAARFLGITRNTLRKRIRKYGFAQSGDTDAAESRDDESSGEIDG